MRDRVDQLIKAGTYTMGAGITPAGIASRLMADGEVCATGEVVAVQVPEALMPGKR